MTGIRQLREVVKIALRKSFQVGTRHNGRSLNEAGYSPDSRVDVIGYCRFNLYSSHRSSLQHSCIHSDRIPRISLVSILLVPYTLWQLHDHSHPSHSSIPSRTWTNRKPARAKRSPLRIAKARKRRRTSLRRRNLVTSIGDMMTMTVTSGTESTERRNAVVVHTKTTTSMTMDEIPDAKKKPHHTTQHPLTHSLAWIGTTPYSTLTAEVIL